MTSASVPLPDRLWARVEKTPTCWLWTGATAPMGWYGHLAYQGRHLAAHRLSWELANGPIPRGLHVLHRCDNPPCVRPDHLFLGTNRDNVRDASCKGRLHFGDANGTRTHPERVARGERAGAAVLSLGDVMEIRRRYALGDVSQSQLAIEFGVAQSSIGRAIRGETWRQGAEVVA